MKTKNLFTSLAAAVMLSAGLAGAGVSAAEPVHAATTQSSSQKGIGLNFRSVSATVNSDKPVLLALKSDNKSFEKADSTYTKGQAVNVYYSVDVTATSPSGQKQSITLYCIKVGNQTENDASLFIPSTEVTTSAKVPTREDWLKQRENDVNTVQDAVNNRGYKYIMVTPKSKKGAKIYGAYAYSAKNKKKSKIFFKATKKKIKFGKKIKAVGKKPIVKYGKVKYIYVGKKRYLKVSDVKLTAKLNPLNLPDDLKNLIVQN